MPSQLPATTSFGDALSALMRERRIGAEQLSRDTGISVRLIRKYKSGGTTPRDYFGDPTENALKLADALGVPVESMFPEPTATAAAR